MKFRRIMQVVFGALFGLVGLLGVVTALTHWDGGAGAKGLVLSAVPLLLAVVAVGVFELQIRGLKRSGQRIRESVEAIAAKLFDAPAEVRPGYDLSVTAGRMAAAASSMETDVGFTADGTFGGARVSVASHVSTLGRQIGELSHVYSHVVVDAHGLTTTFRLSREGAGSMLARATGLASDAKVGDAEFDATWSVDCDEALARAVLDESIRRRLMDLQGKVGLVSQDFGVGTMSVILTSHGLALRWPGPIDVALATYVRDLLLDMRTRLLAYAS